MPNEKRAKLIIGSFSMVVFIVVVVLDRIKVPNFLPFNPNILALLNAIINAIVAVLLVMALVAIKNKKIALHKNFMLTALTLSVVFLVSYILHKLVAGEVRFGDSDKNGVLSIAEKEAVGAWRYIYFVILISHIILAALVLPFVLMSAYRGLVGNYPQHKKLAKKTFPFWLYVALTGPIVYAFIYKYY
ncbi:MAG: DUF420 domain-containing protein [Alphaproteobacteria bacterium]|nr:DUF420 domain-containing protein [Alphaproteobacteria bacterium]